MKGVETKTKLNPNKFLTESDIVAHLAKKKSSVVVGLEGNIGAGKSSLATRLKKEMTLVKAYDEELNMMFLQLFYDDPKTYGWAFQWGMLKTRQYQFALAKLDKTMASEKVCLWDRTMIGDYIFALWNHLTGSINAKEMRVYEKEFGASFANLKDAKFIDTVDVFVFLDDEPENCKRKVENERKHEAENAILLSYYEGIDDLHFAIYLKLMSTTTKVVVTTWDQYKIYTNAKQTIFENLISNKQFGSVSFTEAEPRNVDEIYSDSAKIKTDYKKLKSSSLDLSLGQQRRVAFSTQLMRVSPSEKGIVEEHMAEYPDLIFYKNEYKRLVAHYLSHGYKVIFYSQ